MVEQIFEMLIPLSEVEQNALIFNLRNKIKEKRLQQANQLEIEARRIKDTLNQI
jgi:hypothetical protein